MAHRILEWSRILTMLTLRFSACMLLVIIVSSGHRRDMMCAGTPQIVCWLVTGQMPFLPPNQQRQSTYIIVITFQVVLVEPVKHEVECFCTSIPFEASWMSTRSAKSNTSDVVVGISSCDLETIISQTVDAAVKVMKECLETIVKELFDRMLKLAQL